MINKIKQLYEIAIFTNMNSDEFSNKMCDLIGISKKTILNSGDNISVDEYKLKDCTKIKNVLIQKGYINAGLSDALYLWSEYSESYAAGWLSLDTDDTDDMIFDAIKCYIKKIF